MHYILLLALLPGCVSRQTRHTFTNDKASASSEGTAENSHAWCSCCVEHDITYWRGGTRVERSAADSSIGYPQEV